MLHQVQHFVPDGQFRDVNVAESATFTIKELEQQPFFFPAVDFIDLQQSI
jgi:hypothetical protein